MTELNNRLWALVPINCWRSLWERDYLCYDKNLLDSIQDRVKNICASKTQWNHNFSRSHDVLVEFVTGTKCNSIYEGNETVKHLAIEIKSLLFEDWTWQLKVETELSGSCSKQLWTWMDLWTWRDTDRKDGNPVWLAILMGSIVPDKWDM